MTYDDLIIGMIVLGTSQIMVYMMALASIYYSGQWDKYWRQLRKAS